jgi:hypothetical protein
MTATTYQATTDVVADADARGELVAVQSAVCCFVPAQTGQGANQTAYTAEDLRTLATELDRRSAAARGGHAK